MNRIVIDCGAVQNRADLHAALAQALHFPDWYGGNLDALHDLLTAISEETTLCLLHWDTAENTLGNYAKAAKRAMTHAVLHNPNLTIEYN